VQRPGGSEEGLLTNPSDRLEANAAGCVEIGAPARLHLGFLDLHGGLGRSFGGVGLAIEGFGTRLKLERLGPGKAGEMEASGLGDAEAERAQNVLERASLAFGLAERHRVTLDCAIPSHAGLGSGTQLALALVSALARLHGIALSVTAIATIAARGGRSGIGIGAFEAGGFLLDGGRARDDRPAPIVSRLDFPGSWRLLLTLDRARDGLSGAREREAFAALPAFPESLADHLCRLVIMQLLPGVAESVFDAASSAIAELQARLGDYFAPAQGGRYRSPRVAEAQEWLGREGIVGLGQSSWGPTGFALVSSAEAGAELLQAARERFKETASLEFRLVAGRNRGADIKNPTGEERSQR
jgi:beta-RFAP synthase